MYLTPTQNHWACDIEADNLLSQATRIWCVYLFNCVTKEEKSCTTADEFNEWWAEHPDAILVGQHFIGYDAPMLNKFWGAKLGISRLVDTYVLSQLYNPNYAGGHSLAAWGQRLKFPKTEFSAFEAFTPEMLKYCRNDTILTAYLFRKLTERMRQVGFSEDGCYIEHHAWNIIQNKQCRHGFPFNIRGAQELYVTIRAREEELKNEIYRLWPPQFQIVGNYKGARKKNGEYSLQYERHLGQFPRVEVRDDNTYDVFDWVEFNLGSPIQRISKLIELGWEPVNKTKKGNPKVDEDELLAYAESADQPEVKALARWIVFNSRANMINTWMNAYDDKTGCVHGSLQIAATLRYRHNSPNSANIPAVRTKKVDGEDVIVYGEEGSWTYECRDLWWAGEKGWSLVGIDGTGIQNRCLIHGLIKTVGEERVAAFKELSLKGDIHKRNIEVLGLAHKAAAKKFYYTLMMGGGGERLAADQAQFGTKITAKQGNQMKAKMIASMPGFGELIKKLEEELAATGRIKLCDDTPILVSSPHMVIPYLLQGDESRLMKLAMIYVDQEIRRTGLTKYVFKVADIHDEWQYKVKDEYVEQFIKLALPCFNRAGEHFGYNIPIDGDAKRGLTWAETH